MAARTRPAVRGPSNWRSVPASRYRTTEQDSGRTGFAALVRRPLARPTALLGMMSFVGLLLTYGLNTWLPQIMQANGYGKAYSLTFLLVLNLGAIVGGLIASYVADRIGGAQRVVVTTFILAAAMLVLLPLKLPLVVLLLAVAIAGVGTIGTQVLIYGLVSNYYPTRARAAGVAWCAGFGRLGGIVGPVVGGILVGAGVGGTVAFVIFAALALCGAAVTALVPRNPPSRSVVSDHGAESSPLRCDGAHRADRVRRARPRIVRARRTPSWHRHRRRRGGGGSRRPGIGKTALLRALADQHGNAMWARAAPWESDLPGGMLASCCRTRCPTDPVDAAAHLVDRLRAHRTDAADHRRRRTRRHRVGPGDLDAGATSARTAGARGARDGDTVFPVRPTSPSRPLELTGLSERAVAALAAARGRTLHPSVVSALTQHTRGNPRDVLALLDEVPDSIWSQPDTVLPAPRHLRAQTRDRLADCTADGRALVEALAILGEDGALAEATALAGLADPLPALDSATAAGLLIAATPFEPRLRDSLDPRRGDRA